jgi:hypothetical protein
MTREQRAERLAEAMAEGLRRRYPGAIIEIEHNPVEVGDDDTLDRGLVPRAAAPPPRDGDRTDDGAHAA